MLLCQGKSQVFFTAKKSFPPQRKALFYVHYLRLSFSDFSQSSTSGLFKYAMTSASAASIDSLLVRS